MVALQDVGLGVSQGGFEIISFSSQIPSLSSSFKQLPSQS